jgi:amidase
VSTAPVTDRWFGLLTIGPMARGVLDTARAYDLVLDKAPSRPFAEAAATPPPRLRIAVSTKVPLGALPRPLDADCRRALEHTADLLRSLGHDVRERDPDYGTALVDGIGRYFRGIHEDAAGADRPEKLSARTRRAAALGGLIPRRFIERRRGREAATTARVLALWDDFDVLMTPAQVTPPFEVGRYDGRGPVFTLTENATRVPYQAVFNVTGQPAATVPAGLSAAGLPIAVQLVGRPHDEPTLLSLAAQLEAERPWPPQPTSGTNRTAESS